MPLYDFHCVACGHDFEEVSTTEETPVCPVCGSTETERCLSAPALKTNPRPFSVGPVHPIVNNPKSGSPCGGGG